MALSRYSLSRSAVHKGPFLVALCVSLGIHLVAVLVYGLMALFGLALIELDKQATLQPKELQPNAKAPVPNTQKKEQEQTIFVEVSPDADVPEPKDTPFYSTKNSRAANPDILVQSDRPNIDGKAPNELKTESTPRKSEPLQPAVPAPTDQAKAAEALKPVVEAKPKPRPTPGDTLKLNREQEKAEAAKAEEAKKEAARSRPKTVAEAKMRKQQIPGEKASQEGGVQVRAEMSSLDAKASPFGEYDAQVIAAVKHRWYDLLDRSKFARDRTGRVVLEFRLHSNGSVTDLRIAENNVGDFLGQMCELAVKDPSPYGQWPPEMRRLVGASYRDVRFTFYYY